MIKLINDYYIDADSYQYILKKRVERIKESDNTTYESYSTLGYYTSVPSIIKYCTDQILREGIQSNEINELSKYADGIQTIYNNLNSMLNPLDVDKLSTIITKGI